MNNGYIVPNTGHKRSPLAHEVANKIVDHIVEKKLAPGTKLPNEFELAEQFGVGRGTIREAIKFLVSRNVVEIIQAKGTFVCETPGLVEDPLGLSFVGDKKMLIRDLLDLRIILESYSVRKAAEHATPEQIQTMRDITDKIQASIDDQEKCVEYDVELHKCIAESCGNSVMPLILPVINANIQNFNSLKFMRQWDIVNRGHVAIIDAIEKRDPDLAEEEMINHLAYVSRKMKE